MATVIHTAKITDHWLPFPEAVLAELGWQEGDEIAMEVAGDAIVLSKVGEAERRAIVREAPSRKASITS